MLRKYFWSSTGTSDFFFFPTYLRWLKRHPRARLMLATFVAAGLGNFLFHFLGNTDEIIRDGLLGAAWGYRIYAVYAFLPAISPRIP